MVTSILGAFGPRMTCQTLRDRHLRAQQRRHEAPACRSIGGESPRDSACDRDLTSTGKAQPPAVLVKEGVPLMTSVDSDFSLQSQASKHIAHTYCECVFCAVSRASGELPSSAASLRSSVQSAVFRYIGRHFRSTQGPGACETGVTERGKQKRGW
ncbi:hypothetical protein GQ53DRAFT_91699 [Thozetella sp. PMI_491]|nr:hypothetical protein GQ53DRAFT_91699 [Thozetella sp. PMI_491]